MTHIIYISFLLGGKITNQLQGFDELSKVDFIKKTEENQ